MRTMLACLCLLAAAGLAAAADGKLMHCFYFTPQESATQADWDAFYKATEALPGKIPGLFDVWYGELRRPMRLITADRATAKKLRAGEKDVEAKVNMVERRYGVCMEMKDEAALKVYADHPAHKEWEKVYFKVRRPGTTSVDILAR